ncbi:hypothetical protein [Methylosarcina fibrata]|nr:hypothetical protein [Methylosarcina fibrata]
MAALVFCILFLVLAMHSHGSASIGAIRRSVGAAKHDRMRSDRDESRFR